MSRAQFFHRALYALCNMLKEFEVVFHERIRLHAVHPVHFMLGLEAALTSWGKSRELNVMVIEYDPLMCFPRCTDYALLVFRNLLSAP